jgi:site-specific recombinase XerD
MPGRKPLCPEDEDRLLALLPQNFCLRDQALIVTGLNTGFRITELLSLNVGQVWERGRVRPRVTVTRCHLKNGRGRRRKSLTSRTVPLNAAAAAILEQYLFARFDSGPADPNAPLFPSQRKGMRMSRWRANVIVHLVVRAAGIVDHEVYGTHSLRKTFARKVYKNSGHDINLTRAVLGHREISTTQKYLDVAAGEVDEAVLRLADAHGSRAARFSRRRHSAG